MTTTITILPDEFKIVDSPVYTHNVKRAARLACRCPECKTAYKAYKAAREAYKTAIKDITAKFEAEQPEEA